MPLFVTTYVIGTDVPDRTPLDGGTIDVTTRSGSGSWITSIGVEETVVSFAVFGPSSTAPLALVTTMIE